jgi:hypothetical protein
MKPMKELFIKVYIPEMGRISHLANLLILPVPIRLLGH